MAGNLSPNTALASPRSPRSCSGGRTGAAWMANLAGLARFCCYGARRLSYSSAAPERKLHLPALDGLRGLALVGVLLFHADGLLPGGYLGVDLFFVLSGYLITSLLLAEHGRTGRIDLYAFWVRRARRLLPALLALMPAIAVYGWI